MSTVILNCHPTTPCTVVRRFEAEFERMPASELRLRYGISGDIPRLRFPEHGAARQCDNLWQHTCCEAFLKADNQARYYEFNFAPSTAWALYRFSAYRKDMAPLTISSPPRIVHRTTARTLDLEVRLDLTPLALSDQKFSLALCAVIETRQGSLSYWASRHPAGRPDFHHPDAYALEVPHPRMY